MPISSARAPEWAGSSIGTTMSIRTALLGSSTRHNVTPRPSGRVVSTSIAMPKHDNLNAGAVTSPYTPRPMKPRPRHRHH